jgi:hypothetical protein
VGLGATEGQDAIAEDLLRWTGFALCLNEPVQSHDRTFSQSHIIESEELHSRFTSRDRSGEGSYKPPLLADPGFFFETRCVALQL